MSLLESSARRRLRGYLALARISNSPTVLTNVLAGAALASASLTSVPVFLLAVAMVLFYTAGMFLNDLCDYATDLRERPDRPLPSGSVSRPEAAIATVALFVVGGMLLLYLGWAPFLSGMVLIAVIVLYDLWHKTNPFSPLVMAATRALVYLTAFLAFSSQASWPLVAAAGLLALYIVGLTYVAKSETGPVVMKFWPVAMVLLPAVYFALQATSAIMPPLLLLFVGWTVYSVSFVYRAKARNVGRAVGQLIAGVSLYDGLVLAAVGAPSGAVLALAAFGATLLLQRYIRGT